MLPEQLKVKGTVKIQKISDGNNPKFSHSGTYMEPEHLTFEERELNEANDKRIMAAKYF